MKETLANSAAPLPGQFLAIYEFASQMITDIVLCEDGHAQERSLLDQVIDKVRAGDLWVADRNFSVKHVLLSIADCGGYLPSVPWRGDRNCRHSPTKVNNHRRLRVWP